MNEYTVMDKKEGFLLHSFLIIFKLSYMYRAINLWWPLACMKGE
jgi:hypothetical protein